VARKVVCGLVIYRPFRQYANESFLQAYASDSGSVVGETPCEPARVGAKATS
jgi:hypothetical protein